MCFFMSFPSHDNERKTNIENIETYHKYFMQIFFFAQIIFWLWARAR